MSGTGIVCFIFCFGMTEPEPSLVIDSFCHRYERQILSNADADAMRKLPPDLAKRIQGNEVDYLCQCLGWEDKVCRTRVMRR